MPTSILWVIVSSVSQKLKALLIVLIVATCLGNTLPPAPHHGTAFAQPYPGTENPTQLWNTTWGGADYDSGFEVAVGSDIYLTGHTDSFGAGSADALLVKYGSPPSVGGEVVPLNKPALAATLIKNNIAYITIAGAIVLAILMNRRR
jgi:hypothetical protein